MSVAEQTINLVFNLNAQYKFGNTTLMECALIDRWDMAELFLARTTDPMIKNNNSEHVVGP